jgi:hypothetical protein
MTKWILSYFFITLLFPQSLLAFHNHSNCQNHQHEIFHGTSSKTLKAFVKNESQFVSIHNIASGRLKVRAMDIQGFDQASLKKLDESFKLLEKIVNTEEFKNRIINFRNNENQRSFASSQGLSNEQIFDLFMEGRETLQSNTPGEMNFYLKLYHKRYSKVIGWTNGSINTININWKFFKNFKPHEVAGNLAHEWTHKLGFGHESAAEHDSVPYGIGYIVREMGEKFSK